MSTTDLPIAKPPALKREKSRTLENQVKLPKLPIPKLEDTMKKYLTALEVIPVFAGSWRNGRWDGGSGERR